MSATLIRVVVLVFSAMLVVVFVSETLVGASLTSVTVSVKPTVTGVLPESEVSSTLTVTAYEVCVSRSSVTPDLR